MVVIHPTKLSNTLSYLSNKQTMTSSTAKSLMLLSAALLVSAQLSRVQPQRLRRPNAIDSSGYNEDRELFGKQFRNLEELSLSMSIDISSLAMDEDMAGTTKAPSYWPTYYPTITWSPTSVSLHTHNDKGYCLFFAPHRNMLLLFT